MRNWLAYAKKIGDKSVIKITNEEQIRGSQEINNLNRNFYFKDIEAFFNICISKILRQNLLIINFFINLYKINIFKFF